MVVSLIVFALVIVLMILSVLFFPKIKLGKINIDTYPIITLIGAIALLAINSEFFVSTCKALVADTAVNPLKILVLFLSMTILSIFLDELGFFRFVANKTLKHAKSGQIKLFCFLYLIVSILTIFTSNDVIILSFTPFICYFAKNAKINPIPYLAAEFIAANTWSMVLIIGNPTNIYLATTYGIDFLEYIKISILPTLFAGITSFLILFLLFRKQLKKPIDGEAEEIKIKDKPLLIVGLVHLAVCTILLGISSYINLQMWIVSLAAVCSLFIFILIFSLVRKKKPIELGNCLKRTPYGLIPFVLSMFVMIIILGKLGVTAKIGELFGEKFPILVYGVSSFLSANIINNIPMSVLFSSIIESISGNISLSAVFATIIGSNIGAFLTPIGALAGIMWSSILNKQGVKFGYLDFLKIGVVVAIPSLFAALGGLAIIL